MLTFKTIGPDESGSFFAGYVRSNREIVALAHCRTKAQADAEVKRLDHEQIQREEAIQRERELCDRTVDRKTTSD